MMLECTLLLDDVNSGAFAISVTADIAFGTVIINIDNATTEDNFLPFKMEWDDIFNIS
jgi:hypothetical protein